MSNDSEQLLDKAEEAETLMIEMKQIGDHRAAKGFQMQRDALLEEAAEASN